ncbi:PepSY domain-containing protein [Streptomyces sp. NPDC088116]|uniref:PepSY domain-containing protein n=1 Tax=Streptomyces sp. NPDC088116 TaxID=3365825 RepID=UPI00380FDF8B
MKRNLVIAAITAAALIGGGTAVAVSGAGGQDGAGAEASATLPQLPSQSGSSDDSMTVSPTAPGPTDDTDDSDDADDSDGSGVSGGSGSGSGSQDDSGPVQNRKGLSASEAAAAALAEYPGAVASVERDDDRADRWEVDLLGKDNRWRDLRVDAATGSVSVDRDDDGDDDAGDGDERAALRAATVDAQKAASAALASVPGAVTSIEIDDDLTNRWEVEVRGTDGRSHELNVNAKTGKVTAGSDDDGDDSGDDDGDDD